jgi:CheY-like chemotaxis protein
MERIHQYCSASELLPTGTGRVVNGPTVKLLFTHQALREDSEQVGTPLSVLMDPSLSLAATLPGSSSIIEQSEIRRILLIDPHEICLDLYKKGFSLMYPYALVKTASSSADALALLEQEELGFDIILVEERLKRIGKDDVYGSGSTLLGKLLEDGRFKKTGYNAPLVIGVSAHLDLDKERLEQNGADIVWPKPPPTMNASLRKDLLRCLLTKRGKAAQAAVLERVH